MAKKKSRKKSKKKNKKSKGNKKKKADNKKVKKSKKSKKAKKTGKKKTKQDKFCALGRSKIYHALTCWVIGDVTSRTDVKGFYTGATAEKAGYRPCSRCASESP